jgi:glycosyltransferase involved in cell wall biosynthesis
MPGSPKYSIIIPTRTKVDYLVHSIQSVLSQQYDDYELIVSDNHSKDDTAVFLAGLEHPKLRIVRPQEELPMALHYEFCLSQAKGEWVTLLGDDDAVVFGIFQKMDYILEKYPDIPIVSSSRAYYFWEGSEDMYGNTCINYASSHRKQVRSTHGDRIKSELGLRSIFDLPMIYTTCFVKRLLVEQIKQESGGNFYYSIVPDIYSGVSLSLFVPYYLRVEDPLFWVGTSNKSMGRNNRIYGESKFTESVDTRSIILHPDCNQELHSLGYGPYYLYEARKQCKKPISYKGERKMLRRVFAGILATLLVNKLVNQRNNTNLYHEHLSIVKAEMDRKRLSFIGLYFVSIILAFCIIVKTASQRLFNKWFKKGISFRSYDRLKYPTINSGNKKIELLTIKLLSGK